MDGLTRDDVDLIGIQPSASLARVVRIVLSDDGLSVRQVIEVSSPPPPGTSQTTGVVVGSKYYSVAGVIGASPADGELDRRARILRSRVK
jgi:hypothetical protein